MKQGNIARRLTMGLRVSLVTGNLSRVKITMDGDGNLVINLSHRGRGREAFSFPSWNRLL